MLREPTPNEGITLNVTTHYPVSDTWQYLTQLERINLDQERIWDLTHGNGFIVNQSKSIKDDLKDPNGIFSQRFGQSISDVTEAGNRWRCQCGRLHTKSERGKICPNCNTPVKYVDDNFSYTAWIVLHNPYFFIHPALYMSCASFIGQKKFINMITPVNERDEDGNERVIEKPKNEPFYGIGITAFHERFEEIMAYYLKKNKQKQNYYDDIMREWNKDKKVFAQSIPVYTTHLRPARLDGTELHFEGTNAIYNMMAKLGKTINDDRFEFNKKSKPKEQLIFDLQMKYLELYQEIVKILSGKKGSARALFGGRWNFSARDVIVPNPKLRVDEIKLSYQTLCGLLEQVIINILRKSYSMSFVQAKKFLDANLAEPNPQIVEIIEGLIRDSGRGLPVLINRNPTIALGGVIQMFCTGISKGFTLELPLEDLESMGADFDGDQWSHITLYKVTYMAVLVNCWKAKPLLIA